MFARHAPFLLGMAALALPVLGAQPIRPLPGAAHPYTGHERPASPDWSRLDRLSDLAARNPMRAKTWSQVARRLEAIGSRELGPLTAMDRYWLGSAWWAIHQPRDHVRHPAWAPQTRLNPNVTLGHPEGGNCESSANGHAALLSALGVPTFPVYGYHRGAREGHVWTISDVGGRPMLADVHLARSDEPIWRPSAVNVMSEPTREAAEAFMARRIPDNPDQSGL